MATITSQMLWHLATTNCGGQYNDQIDQEYGHYKTFWCQWLPQFVVAKENNIFDATERLFTAGCCYISLWLKAISLENSKGKLFWSPTVHCGITMATKIRFSSKLCLKEYRKMSCGDFQAS